MVKENFRRKVNDGVSDDDYSPPQSEDLRTQSWHSVEKESGLETCRVCQCTESEKKGDAILAFLGIAPPFQEASQNNGDAQFDGDKNLENIESGSSLKKNIGKNSGFVEFISPDGEVFICNIDIEMGSCHNRDTLVELGCSCKNDLALVHYACALKWFVSHGSTVCEICGCIAKNVRTSDIKKVLSSLKEYEALRERTASGEPNPAQVNESRGVDPDAVAAIRRQWLSEISLWFNPHNRSNNNNSIALSQAVSEQPLSTVSEDVIPAETAAKWAVEGTGILLATGLLTVALAWLIAPRVGKKTARGGLHILLGGVCALTVVVFFRFFVLTRIKYGPARYWAILFIFWFLAFGIWASRTHGSHTT